MKVSGSIQKKTNFKRIVFFHPGKILAVTLLLISMLMASCQSLHLDQDKLRAYPFQEMYGVRSEYEFQEKGMPRVKEKYPPVALSTNFSQDQEFPDLYMFLERTQSPDLFDSMATGLFGNAAGAGNFMDASMLKRIRQILLFRPLAGAALQGIVVGSFPKDLTRVAFMSSGYKERFFEMSDKSFLTIYDDESVRIGIIKSDILAIHVDQGANSQAAFETLVRRAYALSNNDFDFILPRIPRPISVSGGDQTITVVTEEQINRNFLSVLASELDQPPLFGLLSIGLPADSPFIGARIRMLPVEEGERIATEVVLRPRVQEMLPRLRIGLRLAILGIIQAGGLDSSVLAGVTISEINGNLKIAGLLADPEQAAKILPSLTSDIQQFASSVDSPEETDSATTEN